MTDSSPRPGDPLYVPASEVSTALSLGAVLVEGDGRMFIPTILPDGVTLASFARWKTTQAQIIWIGELLEDIVGEPVDMMDVAGLFAVPQGDDDDQTVPLYVPRAEMDRARHIPDVWWERRRRMYVAGQGADFGLVHRYLTPRMRAAWAAERNADTALRALVRARAMISETDGAEQASPREIERPETRDADGSNMS